MIPIKVRNVKIGEGIPKICVPIVGKTKEDICRAALQIKETKADIVEWRADWYEDVLEPKELLRVAKKLRYILGEKPILFTIRTQNEGGELEIAPASYEKILRGMIVSGWIDMVDVEAYMEDETFQRIVEYAKKHSCVTVASNHDFYGTPQKEEMIQRLCYMQSVGADILKIAVMPKDPLDVLTLLSATWEMKSNYATSPVVTMSMSGIGTISRVCGEVFGSAMTFGAVGEGSAPGQIEEKELKELLEKINRWIF